MSEEKKILDDFGKWVDKKIPFNKFIKGVPGTVLETVDGLFISVILKYGYNKLPNDDKQIALEVMSACISGNIENVEKEVIDALVKKINTSLGDEIEKIIVTPIWNMAKEFMFADTTVGGGGPGDDPTDPVNED